MNNDIILPDTAFLQRIEQMLSSPDVGVVGTKLLYEDRTLQHGGIYFFEEGQYKGLPYHRFHHGDPAKLPDQEAQEVPAVTGAFLFCRKDDYLALGGFDENYEEEGQDVDLCLRYRRMGTQIVYLNVDNIIHIENGTRAKGSENWHDRNYFRWKWNAFLETVMLGSPLNKIYETP